MSGKLRGGMLCLAACAHQPLSSPEGKSYISPRVHENRPATSLRRAWIASCRPLPRRAWECCFSHTVVLARRFDPFVWFATAHLRHRPGQAL